jgi:hypothetical protein
MALVLKDRVKETTTTTGTGSFALAGAVTGYDSFGQIGNSNTTYYAVYLDGGSEWEVGIGTYTSPSTLSRDTILASSNAGSVVTFSAGQKTIWCDYPAGKAVYSNASGNIENASLTSPKINEILDSNGNEVLGLLSTASATDYVAIKNGIGVGVPLHISSEGSSANIGLHIQPKGTGLVTISDGTDFNKGIRFRSSGSAASAITLLDAVSTAGHVVTLPDATTTLVGRNTTDTLTNKSISGSTNTLSNIGNSSLTNSAITINGTSTSLGGSINVGTVTSVTGTAPVVSSGGATPAISMAKATTSVDGYLAATDFTTFNNKGNGTVTSVAALTLGTTGTDLSSTVANGTTTPVITLQVPTASATNRGALSAADWTTFNSKAAPFTYTTNYIPFGQGTTTPNQSANLTFDGTTQAAPIQRASNGILTNNKTIGTSFTIPSTDNATSAGPVTLSSGVVVTVSSGSRWVVL